MDEVMRLLEQFKDAVGKTDPSDYDILDDLYSQAIRLQLKFNDDCDIAVAFDFLEAVKLNFFTDYDGIGYFLNYDGERIGKLRCNVQWLLDNRPKEAYFVAWYGK